MGFPMLTPSLKEGKKKTQKKKTDFFFGRVQKKKGHCQEPKFRNLVSPGLCSSMLAKIAKRTTFRYSRSYTSATLSRPVPRAAPKPGLIVGAVAAASLASLYYYSEHKVWELVASCFIYPFH
jgi:hypothetical protein